MRNSFDKHSKNQENLTWGLARPTSSMKIFP